MYRKNTPKYSVESYPTIMEEIAVQTKNTSNRYNHSTPNPGLLNRNSLQKKNTVQKSMINVPNSTEGIGLRYTFIAGNNTNVNVYSLDILSNIIVCAKS